MSILARVSALVILLGGALLVLLIPPYAASQPLSNKADAPAALGKVRWAYYVPYAADSLESLRQNISSLNYLSPYWYQVDGEGRVISSGNPEIAERNRAVVLQLARNSGVRLLPMIKNNATYAAFHPVLAEANIRKKVIDQVLKLTVDNNYDGFHVDFEGLNGEDRPHLTRFMAELALALRKEGKLVTQAVAAKDVERATGWAGAYDYAALAPSNDLIVLMTYGYGTAIPQSTSPFPWVERSVAYASSQIPPEKLLLGLAWYGYDWNLTAGGVSALRHAQAVDLAQRYQAAIEYDETVQTPRFTYKVEGQQHEVWFEDRRSNDAKMDLAFKYGLAGAAGWRIGHEDSGVWASFRDRLGYHTWYLAEGSTGAPFDTWILIQNPSSQVVEAKVTFMKEDGTTASFRYQIKPSSRFSIYANQLVPNAAFSTKIEANAPIFVERAMYFGSDGHDSFGVNAPSRRWYLPEGSTLEGTDTWVLLMNPNSEATKARVTFLREDGPTLQREFTIRATSRLNIYTNAYLPNVSFSTLVEADQPIVAERASYAAGGKAGDGSPGSPYLAQRWYVPEGFTGHKVVLAITNPNPVPTLATVTFMVEGSENIQRKYALKPLSRLTVVANDVLPKVAFSTLIEAEQPIAVERTSYIEGGAGAHSSLGALAPARTWFLAEGSTAPPFQDYVLLQNPNNAPAHTAITFMTDAGRTLVREYDLAPRSRFTIHVNTVVPDAALSVRVDSSLPIVVERSMYFGRGAHASIGASQ